MIAQAGAFFAQQFRKWLPDSFIFAILLTLVAGLCAYAFMPDIGFIDVLGAWQKGFWSLLQFAMQMILILVTGYAIAISPIAEKIIDAIAHKIKRPTLVYIIVTVLGCVFTLISWGWIVMTAILARELAKRIENIDYRILAACVYVSFLPWHGGLSGSIPLLLNSENNFLIQQNILDHTISTQYTIFSTMNIVCNLGLMIGLPILMLALKPSHHDPVSLKHITDSLHPENTLTIDEEAKSHCLPEKNLSDGLNNSVLIQSMISFAMLFYLIWHATEASFKLNLNYMILVFLNLGLLAHQTPARYSIALQRACQNVSDIVLQFPFYAGIMGIMQYTGLGTNIALSLTQFASLSSMPFMAFLIGGIVNLFIPSGGGEWAVIGPTILEATNTLGTNLSALELDKLIARVSMATAYGDSWTNMIQPFWTLTFFPVIAAGTKLKPRDIMGYTFIALILSGVIFGASVTWLPI